MWNLIGPIFRIASLLGLGATVERWLSPGQSSNDNNSNGGGLKAFTILLAVAAIIYAIYKLIGKKLVIK